MYADIHGVNVAFELHGHFRRANVLPALVLAGVASLNAD